MSSDIQFHIMSILTLGMIILFVNINSSTCSIRILHNYIIYLYGFYTLIFLTARVRREMQMSVLFSSSILISQT